NNTEITFYFNDRRQKGYKPLNSFMENIKTIVPRCFSFNAKKSLLQSQYIYLWGFYAVNFEF
ncbi:hypothetical protein, partial [Nostoc sp. CHAB 5715]|uniref:hypothetical protein n=1 Tax=Nostoc sp. CHAB 5715 TaxID=2780400 RepID=UPI001E59FB5E